MVLGILGGTFDPIHNAHLFIAEDARTQLGWERALFIPNREPVHKLGATAASAEHRMAMVRLAIGGNPRFEACDLELNRAAPSYTVDTLAELRALFPEADLHLLLGVDALADMPNWYRPRDILGMATVVAATRPGYPLKALRSALPDWMHDRVIYLETPWMDISATYIRERVARGLTIRYLTPDPVVEYIRLHGLYCR